MKKIGRSKKPDYLSIISRIRITRALQLASDNRHEPMTKRFSQTKVLRRPEEQCTLLDCYGTECQEVARNESEYFP